MSLFSKDGFMRLQRYLSPQAMNDLDSFLDKLPHRAGLLPVISAGVIWMIAGGMVLFAYMHITELQNLQRELMKTEALRPVVPRMQYARIGFDKMTPVVENMKKIYPGLQFNLARNGDLTIAALVTAGFPAWRASIDSLQYLFPATKLRILEMCAGRECGREPLKATVFLEEVDIQVDQESLSFN